MRLHCLVAGALIVLLTAPALSGTPLNLNPARYQASEAPAASPYRAGDIVIVTHERTLYYLFPDNRAKRYAIGVGRDGFRWSGVAVIGRKQEWPDWYPPADMLVRQPYLPRKMAGGPSNPLGRAALYLYEDGKDTLYRVHGTNDPKSIGRAESSGCIRMMNTDIEDLYNRVEVGTRVFVVQ